MSISDEEIRVQEFALAVYRYCRITGGSVTSWIRSIARNRAVGGEVDSLHLKGLAVDVVLGYGVHTDDRHQLASDLGLKLVVESDHDHLQMR